MTTETRPSFSNFGNNLLKTAAMGLVLMPLALPASAQTFRGNDSFQPTRTNKPNGGDILAGVGSAALLALLLYSMHQDAFNCKEYDRYTGRCSKNY